MPTQSTEEQERLEEREIFAATLATTVLVSSTVVCVVTGLVLIGFGIYDGGGMMVFLGVIFFVNYGFVLRPRILAARRRRRHS
jgi:hypothetical protein